jgi:carboxymethylenebutenolidase
MLRNLAVCSSRSVKTTRLTRSALLRSAAAFQLGLLRQNHTDVKRNDGKTCPVLIFGDKGSPSVVIIQEWWGVNDQIKNTAQRFADAGFVSLIPDLYRGKVTKNAQEAGHLMSGLDWGSALQDIQASVNYLKTYGNGKVGVTGFCMGGAVTLAALCKVNGLDAGVVFYGIPPEQYLDLKNIKVPFIAHWAKQDDWCTPQKVQEIEKKLPKGNWKFYWYNAKHAFCNEARPEVYDAKACRTALDRTFAFFGSKLNY